MRQTEIAVVGAGPAGLSAALAAARTGAKVTVIDEYPRPGGQIYRQVPAEFRIKEPGPVGKEYARGQQLLRAVSGSSVDILPETLVWGVQNERTLALYREGEGAISLRAQAIVVATGAYDRPIAFPGWILPGVWTAGGAQAMVKSQQVLPGQRVLLAGSGPFLMPVAKGLVEAGATVVAVVEATRLHEWLPYAARVWGHWDRLGEALAYERFLRRARVPRYYGHLLVSAEGDGKVERATIAAAARDWKPRAGTEKSFDVDLVCMGYGFLVSTELPRLLGCELRYDPAQQQQLPWHGPEMETSVGGVFVAGETTGVGGAELAQVEGKIAGLAAARRLGRGFGEEYARELEAAQARRRHLQRFARLLAELFAMRPGIYELAEPDTPVCRCEEVTVGEVRAAIRRGATSINALKSAMRLGMGPCQGRVCGTIVNQLIARETGQPLEKIPTMSPRPPIKPIPLGALAQLAEV